jgi:hypothetical protein
MDALAMGAPLAEQLRPGGRRHVVDAETAAEIHIAALTLALVIDDHQTVGHAHLVRMPAGRYLDAREHDGVSRIFDVDDGRAGGLTHVADVERLAVHPHLAAAGAVDVRHEARVLGACHDLQ